MNQEQSRSSSTRKWINKNRSDFIGLAGLILGILGIASGYWYYRAALPVPSLSLLDAGTHPRLINMSAVDRDSPIKLVRKDGSLVLGNVYLAHLYLWNSGNIALRREMILRPLDITAPGIEILDSKIGVATRPDITGLMLKKVSNDSLGTSFELLEPGDGCSLTILYAANQACHFTLNGTVLGVKSFVVSETQTSDLLVKTITKVLTVWGVLGGVIGASALIGAAMGWIEKALVRTNHLAVKNATKTIKWIFLSAIACAIAYVTLVASKDSVLSDPSNFVPSALMVDAPHQANLKAE